MSERADVALIETSTGLGNWGDGTPVYQGVLRLFLSELPKDLSRLKRSYALDNLTEVQQLAHSISGMALSVGAIQLNILASALENACESSRLSQLELLIELLHQEHQQLAQELVLP